MSSRTKTSSEDLATARRVLEKLKRDMSVQEQQEFLDGMLHVNPTPDQQRRYRMYGLELEDIKELTKEVFSTRH